MSDQNFPTTIAGFASYLVAVVAYLILNATRLTISDESINELKALYGDEDHEDTYLYWKKQYKYAT